MRAGDKRNMPKRLSKHNKHKRNRKHEHVHKDGPRDRVDESVPAKVLYSCESGKRFPCNV